MEAKNTTITEEEIKIIVKELPTNKATGRDKIPAEFYRKLPALAKALIPMYTNMIENNHLPTAACEYVILPFDKPGKDPSQCASRRPISPLGSFVKV